MKRKLVFLLCVIAFASVVLASDTPRVPTIDDLLAVKSLGGTQISPDGKWIVLLSFLKSEVAPADHPFYKHVYIRLMPAAGGKPKVIAYVYGGQGTINVPSWSPDSKRIAFVSNTDMK